MTRAMIPLVLLLLLATSARADPQQLAPDALKPTVAAPGYNQLQKLAKGAGLKHARAHGKGAPMGGTRFLAVVSSRKQQKVLLMVVDGAGGAWTVKHTLPLALTLSSASNSERCHRAQVAAVAFVGDLDADGKLEAKVRTLYCKVVPAIGDVSVRRLFMINLGGVPRVALSFELGYDALPTAMGAVKARERYQDLNGDGHPDLRVTQRTTRAEFKRGKLIWKRSWRRFLYLPKTDTYKEIGIRKKGKRKKRRRRRRRKSRAKRK